VTNAEFADEGWHCVSAGDLPPDRIVEFARDEAVYRQALWFGKWRDFDPAFNVAGLW
jgi:hypothetical protein